MKNEADDFPWDAERVRFRSAVCGSSHREQLRHLACHDQRQVLLRPAKEKILKRPVGDNAIRMTNVSRGIQTPTLRDLASAAHRGNAF
jgi:hypothetical protein